MEKVIKNCPAREDIYIMTDEFDENALPVMELKEKDFCVKHGKPCFKKQDCVIKNLLEVIDKFKGSCNNLLEETFKLLGIKGEK